mgnify:CR=1 FL=1
MHQREVKSRKCFRVKSNVILQKLDGLRNTSQIQMGGLYDYIRQRFFWAGHEGKLSIRTHLHPLNSQMKVWTALRVVFKISDGCFKALPHSNSNRFHQINPLRNQTPMRQSTVHTHATRPIQQIGHLELRGCPCIQGRSHDIQTPSQLNQNPLQNPIANFIVRPAIGLQNRQQGWRCEGNVRHGPKLFDGIHLSNIIRLFGILPNKCYLFYNFRSKTPA